MRACREVSAGAEALVRRDVLARETSSRSCVFGCLLVGLHECVDGRRGTSESTNTHRSGLVR